MREALEPTDAIVPSTFGAILAGTSRGARKAVETDHLTPISEGGHEGRNTTRDYVRHACAGQPIVLAIAHGEDECPATLTPRRALRLSRDLLEAACRELDGEVWGAPPARCSSAADE